MGFLDRWRKASISARLLDEKIYELVLVEMEKGIRRDGLWAQAIARTEGVEIKATALYIKLRAQSMKDELAISKIDVEQPSPNIPLDNVSIHRSNDDDINGYDIEGYTPLMRAVLDYDLERVILLLALGADPTKPDRDFGTTSSTDLARRLVSNEERLDQHRIMAEILGKLVEK